MSYGCPVRGPLESLAAPMLIRAFRQPDLPTARELLRQLGYEIGVEEVAGRLTTALAAPGLGPSGREEGE